MVTRLGLYGGARKPYGSFAGKVSAGGLPIALCLHYHKQFEG